MKKLLIAGNWKMNKNKKESTNFLVTFLAKVKTAEAEIVIAPSFTLLAEMQKGLKKSKIKLASQDMFFAREGAFTGEISASMLKDFDVKYVILGHSERRKYFLETNELVNKKVHSAIANKLKPIVCVGETQEERKEGFTEQIITRQVKKSLLKINDNDLKNVVIAYEPVWAIGTGEVMDAVEANNMAKFIKQLVDKLYDKKTSISVLYGGSVNASNAIDFFKQEYIDGALIGGASLDAEEFAKIALEK